MSGCVGYRQAGLRLIVPAITLALPAVILLYGLLSLPPTVSALPPPLETVMVAAAAPEPPLLAGPVLTELGTVDPTVDPTIQALAPAIVETVEPLPVTPEPTPRPTVSPRDAWSGPPTFNFVALGVDQREDREIPRTDTILIGRVDLRVPRVTLVSIPRDLLVDIPGYGKDRINTAYVYGEQFKEPGGGIGLLQRTIEKSFGIEIDHFGLVDFQCFRTAVDAVGGVTLNVPRAIVDPKYPTEDYGTRLVSFEPGLQTMNGERALEYARTRSADNDFHRIQRQQLIISAMRDQVLQLKSLPALPSLIGGCRNMRSDLGWRDYLTLATTLRSLNSSGVSFAAIDDQMVVDSTLSSGAAVLLPRWEPIRALLGERFGVATQTAGAGMAIRSSAASPSPLFGAPSASPVASPSPMPSPSAPGGSVAGPPPLDVLPGDVPMLMPPAPPPAPRRS